MRPLIAVAGDMRVRIHRGAGEIGGSCVELESAGARLVLDVGKRRPVRGSTWHYRLSRDWPGVAMDPFWAC